MGIDSQDWQDVRMIHSLSFRNSIFLGVVTLITALFFCFQSVAQNSDFTSRLVQAAKQYTQSTIQYDPSYFSLAYPNGDAPNDRGVCTDLVIRSYRKVGVDLQNLVHEDMAKNFSAYPKIWKLTKTDRNIDHRRVPNLMTFFKRQGASLAITDQAKDYQPGDLVTWDLGGGVPHIGIVTDELSSTSGRYKIAHHIGGTPRHEDVLFEWTITGHYWFVMNR